MIAEFASNSFRALFAAIDKGIYGLIAVVYSLVDELVRNITIFDGDTISNFASRVYVFVGILMLFKVTFSLINYIVNPDTISDKTNGASNIAKNIVITLLLVIITPYAFDFLYRAQNAIINDNLVAKVILGTDADENTSYSVKMSDMCGDMVADAQGDTGTYISLLALRPFYQITEGINDISEIKNVYCSASNVNGGKANVSYLLESDVYKAENDDIYLVDYSILLSTACGVIILILLITICMDIALRAIKLGFLEIIAPIPIISYIDPKSGKDGIFKKWLKEVGRTWASLFIKLATLYFAIYIIGLIDVTISNLSDSNLSMWAAVFILIGALMFVKQFTKLIEDIFGIKLDGMSLHPIKKISEQAAGGKQLVGAGAGTVAAGLGFAGGVGANAWALRNNNMKARKKAEEAGLVKGTKAYRDLFLKEGGKTFATGLGSVAAGGLSAAGRSMANGIKAGDKINPLKNAQEGIKASSQRRNQRADGNGIKEQFMKNLTETAGIKNEYGLYGKNSDDIKRLTNEEADLKQKEDIARKAQIEFEAGNRTYSAETFAVGFERNPVGTGDRIFEAKDSLGNYKYLGTNSFERYKSYMNELNTSRVNEGKGALSVLDENTFNAYSTLEENTHYYNVKHEATKKAKSKAEKLFEEKK